MQFLRENFTSLPEHECIPQVKCNSHSRNSMIRGLLQNVPRATFLPGQNVTARGSHPLAPRASGQRCARERRAYIVILGGLEGRANGLPLPLGRDTIGLRAAVGGCAKVSLQDKASGRLPGLPGRIGLPIVGDPAVGRVVAIPGHRRLLDSSGSNSGRLRAETCPLTRST